MSGLEAGAAAVNITPFIGGPMSGYSQLASEGIADPLHCKALVLHDGDTKIALVTNDLAGVGLDLVNRVRARVTSDTGIPGTTSWSAPRTPISARRSGQYMAMGCWRRRQTGAMCWR